MYAYGEGVLKDLTKAKYWTKKAYENPDEPEKGRARITWDKFELWKY
jgi:TPR repeat protein